MVILAIEVTRIWQAEEAPVGNVDFSKLMKSNDVLLSFGPSIRAAARIEGAFTGTRGTALIYLLCMLSK